MVSLVSQGLLTCFGLCMSLFVAQTQGRIVVCYYTNWAQYRPSLGAHIVEHIDPYLCTHFIYAFAQLSGNTIIPYEVNDDQNPWRWRQFTQLKTINPKAKCLLALGGYNHGTKRFSVMAASAANRAEFIKSLIVHLLYWGFHGFDLDWEYPGEDSPADKENLSLLLKELHLAFEKDAVDNKRERLLLTAALPASITKVTKGYDIAVLNEYLDFINVMAYDYHGLWENVTGRASPLNAPEGDPLSVVSTVNHYLEQGASRSKLNIGLGLYARSWTLSRPGDTEIGSPAIAGGTAGPYTREPGILSHYEVCALLQSGYTQRFDPVGQVMYAYKGNQWITFENEDTLNTKIDYILSNGFGAMVWSLDQDDHSGSFCGKGRYPLIKQIASRLINTGDSQSDTSSTQSSTTSSTTVTPSTASTSTMTSTTTTSTTTTRPAPTNGAASTTNAPTNSRTSRQPFVCTQGYGTFPDTTSCRTYYLCKAYLPFLIQCHDPKPVYSPQERKCVLRTNYACPI